MARALSRLPGSISTEFCCSRLLLPLEGDGSGQTCWEKAAENSGTSRKSGFLGLEENPYSAPRNLQRSSPMFSVDCAYECRLRFGFVQLTGNSI